MEAFVKTVREVFEEKRFKFFEKGKYNLNLVYIRTSLVWTNNFDDVCLQIFKEKNDDWKCYILPCTTKAGLYWVQNPVTHRGITGVGIIKEGQYLGAWTFDDSNRNFHNSPALLQTGVIEVYRDLNKDNVIDKTITQKGDEFGMNQHIAYGNFVGNNSAGCVNFTVPFYWYWVENIRKSAKVWGNKFSSTFLEKEDFLLK